jgi:uncharacterized protein (TIGR03000 family)
MLRNVFTFGSLLLLVGAALIATPDFALAQRGGGGHMGGGHFGGGHVGGGRFGGYGGGFRSAGYHSSYAHSYAPHYGYHHYDNHAGYHHYYPSYGYGYGYYPYNDYSVPYTSSAPVYDWGNYEPYGYGTQIFPDYNTLGTQPSAGSQAYYPPATVTAQPVPAQIDNTSHISVSAPANAEIWIDGTKTTSTGSVRNYQSPALEPGTRYAYEVEARWNENGQEMKQTQRVAVTAGAHVSVRFPVPPKTTGQASAVK